MMQVDKEEFAEIDRVKAEKEKKKEKEKVNDVVDVADVVEEGKIEENGPVQKRNLIKNYFIVNQKVKAERNVMIEL